MMLFFMAPLCASGGYIFGAWLWRNMERRYEEIVLLLKAAGRGDDPSVGRSEDEVAPDKKSLSDASHRPDDFFTR